MRLIRQIVKKKFINHLENIANRRNTYWDFFMAYNVVRVLQGVAIKKDVLNLLNFNWKQSILSENPEKFLIIMDNFVQTNNYLISNFLRDTEAMEEEETKYTGMYEKGQGIVGVLSYDYSG